MVYAHVFEKDFEIMSGEAPTDPEDLTLAATTSDSLRIHWAESEHDVAVHEYEVTIDDEVVGTEALNAFNIEGLDAGTSYKVGITAIDFAGNRSETTYHNVQTNSQ